MPKKNNNIISRTIIPTQQGLKYKLRVAAALMSILPLLVCGYLVSNYILPRVGLKVDVILTLFISVIIAASGFFVVKEVFDRILSMIGEAKLIAAGDITRKIYTSEVDEVGDLGNVLNELTDRIRNNMDELKHYSDRTTEINLEIQKRVIILSSLLNISSLISQAAKLEDILKLITEKARFLGGSDLSFMLLREESHDIFRLKYADGLNSARLMKSEVSPGDNLYSVFDKATAAITLDKQHPLRQDFFNSFQDIFAIKNALIVPVHLRGRVLGVLGVGNNRESFIYHEDETEMLDIFAKQINIAIENDILANKVEKLEIKDALTGLFNEAYILTRLQEEIRRAIIYQRPCSFVLLNIDNFKEFYASFGSLPAEATLKKIGVLLKDSLTDIDRVARVGDNEFALVLPEKNKRNARDITDNIRKKIEFTFSEEQESGKRLTASAGVSENPLDGINAEELIQKAREMLKNAKSQGKNCVVSS